MLIIMQSCKNVALMSLKKFAATKHKTNKSLGQKAMQFCFILVRQTQEKVPRLIAPNHGQGVYS
jgi:hypothetical protein